MSDRILPVGLKLRCPCVHPNTPASWTVSTSHSSSRDIRKDHVPDQHVLHHDPHGATCKFQMTRIRLLSRSHLCLYQGTPISTSFTHICLHSPLRLDAAGVTSCTPRQVHYERSVAIVRLGMYIYSEQIQHQTAQTGMQHSYLTHSVFPDHTRPAIHVLRDSTSYMTPLGTCGTTTA